MRTQIRSVLRIAGRYVLLALALTGAALPAVFLNSIYGYLPALTLLALLLLSWLWLWRLGQCLQIKTENQNLTCVRGGSVAMGLRIENRSRLLCPQGEALITITDLFGGGDSQRRIRFTAGGRASVALDFDMDMSHIGLYSVGLERIVLTDFFGVFQRQLPLNGVLTALVTPRLRPMDEFQISGEVTAETSRDTRVTVVGGTDYTGVREYALGDPMKQIHWKLSAHSREYMTKLQESSRQQEYIVMLDFAVEPQSDRERLMELNDCLIETALSLLDTVSREDAGYALLYVNRERFLERTVPAGPESFPELLRSFAFVTPASVDFPDAANVLAEEGKSVNRGSNLLVVTSRLTESLLRELQLTRRQRRSPELFFVVPAAWTSRDLENAAHQLRTLDDLEIPHYFISTAENFRS